ncbi:kinase-like domain-containing protein [Rhizophagus clarus]|uniref:Kinase-like domain-containing protein n=2 Tax=Rhizophagus clarus TaxID=94130 RepID=A0A8H3LFQ6_9GLOM|nr:kinase-like domain-containing protein [Rhizophagus clarus]
MFTILSTQDLIFIMPYYNSDLTHFITNDFYNTSWYIKICKLQGIITGLAKIHTVDIIHRDLHSGNILIGGSDAYNDAKICDLGTSKSATELTDNDDNNEIYGIIPYVAPEVLQGKKYKSSNIGPMKTNDPGAIYKSRYLSGMIKSAASTKSLRSQYITSEFGKRNFEDNQFENNFIADENIKKIKLIKDENYEYATKELEFDIDINSKRSNDNGYITGEINVDINTY